MFIEERHQAILSILESEGRITVGDIQKQFNVGLDSARRDLRILEEKGLCRRTHGGAIPAMQVNRCPSGYNLRQMTEVKPNYDAIAKKAVLYIREGDFFYLTSASVGYLMTRRLPRDFEYTVVTNSIIIADEIKEYANIKIRLIGGIMRPGGNTVDAIATEEVRRMRYDRCFITGAALSASFGMSVQTPESMAFIRAVAECSRQTIALFPCEKIGCEAANHIIPAADIDILITDTDASESQIAAIAGMGVEVITVEAVTDSEALLKIKESALRL